MTTTSCNEAGYREEPAGQTEYVNENASTDASQEQDSTSVLGTSKGSPSLSRGAIIAITCAFCYAILLFLMATGSQTFAACLALVLVIFGWRALDMIRPNVFLVMPVVGWLIYFAVKFVISYFVGIVVGPYQIGRGIAEKLCAAQRG